MLYPAELRALCLPIIGVTQRPNRSAAAAPGRSSPLLMARGGRVQGSCRAYARRPRAGAHRRTHGPADALAYCTTAVRHARSGMSRPSPVSSSSSLPAVHGRRARRRWRARDPCRPCASRPGRPGTCWRAPSAARRGRCRDTSMNTRRPSRHALTRISPCSAVGPPLDRLRRRCARGCSECGTGARGRRRCGAVSSMSSTQAIFPRAAGRGLADFLDQRLQPHAARAAARLPRRGRTSESLQKLMARSSEAISLGANLLHGRIGNGRQAIRDELRIGRACCAGRG